MACKIFIFFAILAVANAGYLAGPAYTHTAYSYGAPQGIATPAVVSQYSNILRSHGNLGQVSSYGKTVSTPHSSVYKSDIRVSNDAFAYPYAQGYAAAPVYSHAYATPSYTVPTYGHGYAASTSSHGYPVHVSSGLLGVAYSPATSAAHFSYSNGYGLHYSY